MVILNNTLHAWWREQLFLGEFYCNQVTFFNTVNITIVYMWLCKILIAS